MRNITTVSDVASYLCTKFQNELVTHGHYENPETQNWLTQLPKYFLILIRKLMATRIMISAFRRQFLLAAVSSNFSACVLSSSCLISLIS